MSRQINSFGSFGFSFCFCLQLEYFLESTRSYCQLMRFESLDTVRLGSERSFVLHSPIISNEKGGEDSFWKKKKHFNNSLHHFQSSFFFFLFLVENADLQWINWKRINGLRLSNSTWVLQTTWKFNILLMSCPSK